MSKKPAPPPADATTPPGPATFLAAAAALAAIDDAVRTAQHPAAGAQPAPVGPAGPEQALDALILLRELRTQLAGWEAGLVETARATWADLAHPMGVASRQAAENRYLRLAPPHPATPPGPRPGSDASKPSATAAQPTGMWCTT